jgi:hypothetical protein
MSKLGILDRIEDAWMSTYHSTAAANFVLGFSETSLRNRALIFDIELFTLVARYDSMILDICNTVRFSKRDDSGVAT